MAKPRGIEERIDWFLKHKPSKAGMCAQHSWHALGGNNGCPPAWGAKNANAVYDKVKAAGKFGTEEPPRGALVLWKYGKNGHAAIALGNGKIATTDPSNGAGKTGVEDINYPTRWGAKKGGYKWTDYYNGVTFAVGKTCDASEYKQGGKVYSSKMWHGQKGSDSVWNVQHALNSTGSDLPETGNYLDQTLAAVKAFQESQGWKGADADGIVGPGTARKLGLTWVDDGPPPKPKSDDEPAWAGKLRKALACVSARVDYRPRWTDPAIAGKHTWSPSWVVLHHTAGTNSLRWIEDGADHPPVPAAHFLIDRDGTVHVFSCHETYHAGAGGPLGGVPADRMNNFAWGIEIESPGKEKDLTDEQVKSAAQLCAGLIKHAGVLGAVKDGPWQVINHKTWSSRKTDTLYSDSWWRDRIVAELEA